MNDRIPLARRPLLVAATAVLVGGCVTLLPRAAPARLYSFGARTPLAPGAIPATVSVTLPAAAEGDGLLTRTGAQAAYVAGARWVSPASVLFREAAQRALSQDPTHPRAEQRILIAVVRFETEYAAPPGAGAPAPVFHIEAFITLDAGDRGLRRLGAVSAEQRASDNRIGPIVQAVNGAVDELLTRTRALIEGSDPAASDQAAPDRNGA